MGYCEDIQTLQRRTTNNGSELDRLLSYIGNVHPDVDAARHRKFSNKLIQLEENINSVIHSAQRVHDFYPDRSEEFIVIVKENLDQLQKVSSLTPRPMDWEPISLAKNLLTSLFRSTFVVEEHPAQVQVIEKKVSKKFSASVKVFGGDGRSVVCQKVTVSLVKKEEAANVTGVSSSSCGDFQRDTEEMQYNPANHCFVARFVDIMVKNIHHCRKDQDRKVTDQMYFLRFQSSISVFFGENQHFEIPLSTDSKPIVFITNRGQQQKDAEASIKWDVAFGKYLDHSTEATSWKHVEAELQKHFQTNCGKPLTSQNLETLVKVAFHGEPMNPNTAMFTRKQFCKQKLTCQVGPGKRKDCPFGFWQWFDSIVLFVKENLLELWQANLIMGFVERDVAAQAVFNEPVGTFIIRFCHSTLASVSLVLRDQQNVLALGPWNASDLKMASLPDRIRQISELKYLYQAPRQHQDKITAFDRYFSITPKLVDEDGIYTATTLMASIADSRNYTFLSHGNTASYRNIQAPHDGHYEMTSYGATQAFGSNQQVFEVQHVTTHAETNYRENGELLPLQPFVSHSEEAFLNPLSVPTPSLDGTRLGTAHQYFHGQSELVLRHGSWTK